MSGVVVLILEKLLNKWQVPDHDDSLADFLSVFFLRLSHTIIKNCKWQAIHAVCLFSGNLFAKELLDQ